MSLLSDSSGELIALALALAVGLIIGFERGWRHREEREAGDGRPTEGRSAAGIRTFALSGLLGGVMVLLAADGHALVLGAGVLVLGALLVASYLVTARAYGDFGATTEVALLLTFLLGALAVAGHQLEAVAAAVVTAVLLGFKAEIHNVLERLDRRELQSSLQFLVVALVVIPLLPNRDMGPWQSINPRVLGLLVLLIAGIGFVGYFSIRVLGARAGLMTTALLGGLTSSTAVTVSFARLARRSQRRHALFGAGIALACGTMVPRLLVEVAAVNPALILPILPGVIPLAVIPLLAALWVARSGDRDAGTHEVGVENPLELKQALIIGGILGLVFTLTQGAQDWLGDSGVYAIALISGVADVDAVALAVARQAQSGSLEPEVASRAIVLAALSNTAFKTAFAAILGGPRLTRWVVPVLALALATGIAGFVLI